LVDAGVSLLGIEIKASQTFSAGFIKGLQGVKTNLDTAIKFSGIVIYKGENEQTIDGFSLKNFMNLDEILSQIK
jgi:hypothetical protein